MNYEDEAMSYAAEQYDIFGETSGSISKIQISMRRSEAASKITRMQNEEAELFSSGQDDYARDADNVFANFTRLADILGLSPEQILLVYAMKHLDAIVAWINGHDSGREDVRGRINDLRVYLSILYLMVEAYNGNE